MERALGPNRRSWTAWARFLGTAAAGLTLDLWSKWYSFAVLTAAVLRRADGSEVVESRTYEWIPGFVHFHVTRNYGAVFGLGQGFRWLFVAVSLAAVLFLVFLFLNSRRQWFYQIVLGMLLAGVLGNLYDRLVFGYVRDMIYALTRWKVFPWIFNVADSLLCVGVGIMIVYSLFAPGQAKHTAKAVEEVG